MKKTSIIIILTVLCIGLISTTLIQFPTANAVSYYNWIKGSDMETTTNYIEDGGFESNGFNNGVQYGNWSGTSASFQSSLINSGVYALQILVGGNAWYNLTDITILGADINSFYCYVTAGGTATFKMRVCYSDGTYTDTSESTNATQFYYFNDFTITDAKYVVAFQIRDVASNAIYLDDFFMGIQDQYSQDQYNFDTYPWRTTGLAKYWQQIGYWDSGIFSYIPFFPIKTMPIGGYVNLDMIGHNLVWGRNSNGSGYIGYDESTAQFIQDISYLDSDSVNYIDLWAYAQSDANIAVKINIIYSDRTFDTKSVNITNSFTWEHLNFGKNWIDSNKYIIQIQISLANYYAGYVNIDDVGVWSSLPSNSYRFTYTVSPSPIKQSVIGFDAYQGQTYTFTGYLWDINGTLTESGTVTISTDYGSTTATLTDGIFSFTFSKRTATSDFTEQIGISVNNGETIEYFELTVNWIYSSGGGGGDDTTTKTNNLVDWIVMFCVIFIPAILFAGSLYENNQEPDAFHISPMYGIIGGLVLSIGLGVYTSLVPLWMIILMIIAIVLLIVGMVRQN